MKIKYLKPAPNATTGDIKDINTAQAKILIQLGFAEEYVETDSEQVQTTETNETPKQKKSKPKKTDTENN